MKNHWDTIAAIVVGHLPDSIEQRIGVLDTLHRAIPAKTNAPLRDQVGGMLEELDSHLLHQRTFAFAEQVTSRGSARLGDKPLARGSARLSDKAIQR